MPRGSKKCAAEPRWRISLIKSTPPAEIGTVTAPDEATAIAKAIKEFAIPKPQQARLVARQVE
jgi:hypothetical protein